MAIKDDRDLLKKRTPPSGVAAIKSASATRGDGGFEEDVTGQYDGDELDRLRAMRPADQRIARLEKKHDDLTQVVTETRVIVGEMSGQLSVLPELISVVRESANRASQREHVTFTAQVDVDKARQLDSIEGKKANRQRITTIIGGAVTLLTSGAVIHWLVGKL